MRQALRAAARTLEQQATLAPLLKVPRAEIEACRITAGGYRFTREKLARWGVPWPRLPDGGKPWNAPRRLLSDHDRRSAQAR
jgi:hypothetical protein